MGIFGKKKKEEYEKQQLQQKYDEEANDLVSENDLNDEFKESISADEDYSSNENQEKTPSPEDEEQVIRKRLQQIQEEKKRKEEEAKRKESERVTRQQSSYSEKAVETTSSVVYRPRAVPVEDMFNFLSDRQDSQEEAIKEILSWIKNIDSYLRKNERNNS